jgi:hypothetical protein
MIAQTEANNAYSIGRAALADEAGMEEKRWNPSGECCDVCQENVDAGWIDIDEDFPTGDSEPTAHPRCDCDCSYRKGHSEPGEYDVHEAAGGEWGLGSFRLGSMQRGVNIISFGSQAIFQVCNSGFFREALHHLECGD